MEFFQLLRYSIGASEVFSADLSSNDWESVYRMSVVHSLSDVLFYGVQKAGLKPSFDVLMKWVADDELIRSRNKKTNSVVLKVCRFFEQKGFRSCILKV